MMKMKNKILLIILMFTASLSWSQGLKTQGKAIVNAKEIKEWHTIIEQYMLKYREKDIEDLRKIKDSNQFNKELLDKVVIEAKESAVTDRRYLEMVDLYKDFFKE